jgi:hypothetical protein
MTGRIAPAFVLALAVAACRAATPPARSMEGPVSMRDMPGMAGDGMSGRSAHDAAGAGPHSKAAVAFLFPDGDDKGWSTVENGMQHNTAPDVPLSKLDPATRANLLRQLALTMDVSRKYPTVKEAEAAGYRRAGPFLPGLGTHYVGGRISRTGLLTDEDILHPSTIIYAGTKPDSPIAGFMYIAGASAGSSVEPEGFAGSNDHWHYHTGICLVAGANGAMEALGFDGSITQESCRAKTGNWVATTQYLLHVWTVPGFTDPLGVFAHVNPALTCGDGTYYTDSHEITNACRVP